MSNYSSSDNLDFFSDRAKKAMKLGLDTAMLYQDKVPGLAEARSLFEVQKILPLLDLDSTAKVLDIGYGLGRWAKQLAPKVGLYIGTDYNQDLIEYARKHEMSSNATYHLISATDSNLPDLASGINTILFTGVAHYLNDQELLAFALNLRRIAQISRKIRFYLRAPISTGLTFELDKKWSSDLDYEYSAIYRDQETLLRLIFQDDGVMEIHRKESGDLYPLEMNNRIETKQFFWVGDLIVN